MADRNGQSIATALEPSSPAAPALLRMEGIQKSFPGVQAIRRGEFELRAGEIHALAGENGAGKSTLIKILAGAHAPDAGSIFLDGRPVWIRSPLDARALGIAIIYQEFNLAPMLSVRENLFLGREATRAGFIRAGAERNSAHALLDQLGFLLDPDILCRDLTVAQQQAVEIAKALSQNARVLVLDEPTAALSDREVERLHAILRGLRARGIGVIYISHRLDEIFALCDRATVMRDGEHVATVPVNQLTRDRLIEWMVGRKLEAEFPRRNHSLGEPRLEVRGLSRRPAVKNVSFVIRRGEVLGLTGLVGAGRTEAARLLFGADRSDGGDITLDGRRLDVRSPRAAIRQGLCLLTEDRKQQGLVLMLSARENFGLPNLQGFARGPFVREGVERRRFMQFVDNLKIKVADSEQRAQNLSGGNQQKVVLAKWLQACSEVIIFDEPTRGIDVGAKFEIYCLINELAAAGKSILLISSELPEVLGMCDRILVMRAGQISGELDGATATQAEIMRLATQ